MKSGLEKTPIQTCLQNPGIVRFFACLVDRKKVLMEELKNAVKLDPLRNRRQYFERDFARKSSPFRYASRRDFLVAGEVSELVVQQAGEHERGDE